MNYYKLGCNWESNSPVFFDLLRDQNIVIGVEDTKYEKGDYVLVADGFDAKAIAIIQEIPIVATDFPQLYEDSFNEYNIPFTSRINVYENVIWIDVKKPFQYKLQAGIRKINQAETINRIELTVRDFLASLELNKLIDLLKSKNQIILQGPPGTGKTRLAEEIAIEITANKSDNIVKRKTERFFKSFNYDIDCQKSRNLSNLSLEAFVSKFPKEKISAITLEEYTNSKSNDENFCYWLQHKLSHIGKYKGPKSNFKVYYDNENKSYVKAGIAQDLDDNEAVKVVVEKIQELVNDPMEVGENFPMEKDLVLRILNAYFPETFFPITSENILDQLLIALEIDIKDINYLEKNKQVQKYFEEQNTLYNTKAKNFEFMHYLYQTNVLSEEEHSVKVTAQEKDFYKVVQFHSSYSYEDFVRGIAVETTEKGDVIYKVKNRILAQMAQDAIVDENNNYVLIIDEINRANLSSVLGELIYALEYRGKPVESLYELKDKGREIVLPKNLFIIGTMNTADRSVGHIDYAIRRRFAFESVLPQDLTGTLDSGYAFAKAEFDKVKSLFVKPETDWKRSDHLSEEFDPKDVCIGHSYFIHKDVEDITQRIQYEIKPILEEYIKDGVLKDSPELSKALKEL